MLPFVTLACILTPSIGVGAKRTAPRHPATGSKPEARAPGNTVALTVQPGLTNIDPRVVQLAFESTTCAINRGAVDSSPSTLTIIDYSKPSTEPRLWVIDLQTSTVLFEELVAHGSGSGDNLATRFSNDLNSHQSSLGLFVTDDTYIGKHGYSLRLNGLEPGINHLARERAIVMHGAHYVSRSAVEALGRLGRSWGCPALSLDAAKRVIDRIRGGNVVFAYYPDPTWLGESKFLSSCKSPTA